MKTSRKVLALILSVLLVVTVFAGCNNNTTTSSAAPSTTESKGGDASTSGEASRDPITYTLWFGEHASEPYHEDTWVLAPWALEKFNITLDITAVPATDWETKRNSSMMGGVDGLPDILMGVVKETTDEYGEMGMFLDLMTQQDNMPNLMKVMEDFPLYESYLFNGEKLYAQPTTIATEGAVNMTAYYTAFVREDIMKEVGVTEFPSTFEGVTELFQKMKDAYPDVYPWSQRKTSNMRMIVNFFAPGLGIDVAPIGKSNTGWAVWNEDSKTFTSIMEEENFKAFIEWMSDLYAKGLLDPSFNVDETAQWETKMTAGQAFFAVDYYSRPDMFNPTGQSMNENFQLSSVLTPAMEGGEQKIFADVGMGGYNGFKATVQSPERLAEFLDAWYYTEEGCLLTTYGIEGETYTKNEDGTLSKHFTDEVPTALDFDAAYGVNYLTFYGFKPDFFGYNLYDEGQSDTYNYSWNLYKDEQIDLPPTIVRSAEEATAYMDYQVDLQDTFESVLTDFISGRRSMDQWDDAKAELDQVGYATFLEQINGSYQRLYG